MSMFEELKTLGVNVDEGLMRINGNEKLYKRLLGLFLKEMANNHVQPDFDGTDCTEIIEKVHSIKGCAGNLSITPVYEAYTEILKLLRAGEPEEARPILENIQPVQEEIIRCIEKYMETAGETK